LFSAEQCVLIFIPHAGPQYVQLQLPPATPPLAERPFVNWYFVSGFCSVLYELVRLRLSMAQFGVTTAMVSIVLSVFMAGLGLGSWASGKWLRTRGGFRNHGQIVSSSRCAVSPSEFKAKQAPPKLLLAIVLLPT